MKKNKVKGNEVPVKKLILANLFRMYKAINKFLGKFGFSLDLKPLKKLFAKLEASGEANKRVYEVEGVNGSIYFQANTNIEKIE